MAGEGTDTAATKTSWYNPKNLVTGAQRLFGSELDATEQAQENIQGEVFWMTLAGYILGNSLGTANERAGRKRVHLGPVYIW
jgi:hypothetical protein